MITKHSNSFNDNQDQEFGNRPMVQIGITVHDIEQSLDFYVNNLGCKIKGRQRLSCSRFFGTELSLKKRKNKDKTKQSQ